MFICRTCFLLAEIYGVGEAKLQFITKKIKNVLQNKPDKKQKKLKMCKVYSMGNNGWPLQSKYCIVTVRPFIVIRTVTFKLELMV